MDKLVYAKGEKRCYWREGYRLTALPTFHSIDMVCIKKCSPKQRKRMLET